VLPEINEENYDHEKGKKHMQYQKEESKQMRQNNNTSFIKD
jgi:hypothetical protein